MRFNANPKFPAQLAYHWLTCVLSRQPDTRSTVGWPGLCDVRGDKYKLNCKFSIDFVMFIDDAHTLNSLIKPFKTKFSGI